MRQSTRQSLVFSAIAVVSFSLGSAKADPALRVHGTVGGRWIDPTFGHTEASFEAGVRAVGGDSNWPLLPAAYYARTSGMSKPDVDCDCGQFDWTTYELGIGVVRAFNMGGVEPYLGGGWVRTKTNREPITPDVRQGSGSETGMWLGAGATYPVMQFVSLGVGGRFRTTLTRSDDIPVWSASALIGVSLPSK
jgi:hypothetical protein